MAIYYRVDLENGIQIEKQKSGHYADSPEMNITVFRNIVKAKRRFNQICSDEIERITRLRRQLRGPQTREELARAIDHHRIAA